MDILLDEETQREIETAEEGEWVPSDEDEAVVEKYLRALRYYREEIEAVEQKAMAERDRIEAWRLAQSDKAQRSVDYLTFRLKQFSLSVGKKRRTSPNGTLSWAKGRQRVEVSDDFCAKHSDAPWVRWKAEPDKKAILDHIKETGEIPEGADLVTGEDTFKVVN